DRHDNDPGLLLRYVLAALDHIEPIERDVQHALLAWASNDPPRSLRGLALLVAAMPSPFVLVLDHVEALHNPLCGDLIAELVLNLPPGGRCALASRREPPIPVARLLAQGLLTQVGLTDLAMDRSEAAQLLASAGCVLPEEEVDALVVRTEGWPVVLYL